MESRPVQCPPERKPTYTVEEVAAIMQVSQQTVRKAIRRYLRGERGPDVVPGRLIGTCYRVQGTYIEQWLRSDEPQPVRTSPYSTWN